MRTLALAVLVLVAVGCDSSPAPLTGTLTVFINEADAPDVARTAAILSQRLSEYLWKGASISVDSQSGKSIVFSFRGAPDYPEDLIRYFVLSRGEFRLLPADDRAHPWATQDDVIDARAFSVSKDAPTSYIGMRFSKERGSDLLKNSGAYVGREILVTMDDEVVSRATVRAPFGGEVQFDSPGGGRSLMLVILLRYGALPVEVTSYKYERH